MVHTSSYYRFYSCVFVQVKRLFEVHCIAYTCVEVDVVGKRSIVGRKP